ncbi:MAG TPA: fumarylacetoacetase [Egibacteraceae bacterium]|nr:fumarylacetoacetase [Egibacteraceae bacterium]
MASADSWAPVDAGSDFPLENLPYGIFSRTGQAPRAGVAIGSNVLDLSVVAVEGLLDSAVEGAAALFSADSLNPFMARGPQAWSAVRARLAQLLDVRDRTLRDLGVAERALVAQRAVSLHLPFAVADYVDFYSSLHHAANLGRMFRPDGEALLPNWRHLPVGYHGRAGTVVVSGTGIARPHGQSKPPGAALQFGPTTRLDLELEVGFVTGTPTPLGQPIPVERAEEHIFGLVLVNDWSARDIQAWEYQPLGPFLGKSFATSISPWVVPLAALAPYRCSAPAQDPAPLGYLRGAGDAASIDLSLEVALQSEAMRSDGRPPEPIARANHRDLYWTMAQQLAHATANGASTRTGDLYASGTISGEDAAAVDLRDGPPALGSLIELTLNGQRPLTLPDGSRRTFLEDGDTVRLRGWCGGGDLPRVGFGELTGTVLPAADARAPGG